MRSWTAKIARAAAALGMVAVAGCAESKGGPNASAARCRRLPQEAKGPAGVSTCQATARLEVAVRGAETIRDSGPRKVMAVQFYRGKVPQQAWFVALQMVEPVSKGPGLTYRAGFQLAAGSYRGEGRYSLRGRQENAPAADDAFLEVIKGSEVLRYDRIVRPCALVVEELALEGSLDCPGLGGPQDREVSLTMRWKVA